MGGQVISFLTSDGVSDTRDRIFDGYETWMGVPQAEADKAQAEADKAQAELGLAEVWYRPEGDTETFKAAKIAGGVALVGIVVWYLAKR